MIYTDTPGAPQTAEEHERRSVAATYLTAAEARKILAAHGVRGRSKLSGEEAVDMASERWPVEAKAARMAKVVRYRWSVAHGLGVGYDELEEIERRAGVVPLPEPGERGAYASAEDVARVYAAAAERRGAVRSIGVRLSVDGPEDEGAAKEVYERLAASYECTSPTVHDVGGRGRGVYFTVSVPRG